MTDEIKKLGRDFILEVSNDEFWIDGSSLYVKNKLAELLRVTYESGKNSNTTDRKGTEHGRNDR